MSIGRRSDRIGRATLLSWGGVEKTAHEPATTRNQEIQRGDTFGGVDATATCGQAEQGGNKHQP